MGTHFSKRGGHSGVMAGHEVMAYTFLSGTQCQPKRRTFSGPRRRAVSVSSSAVGCQAGGALALATLSRSPSPPPLRREYRMAASLSKLVDSSGSDSGEESRDEGDGGAVNIEIDVSSLESGSEVRAAY